MTRTSRKRPCHSFQQIDGKWINPNTNLPFQKNDFFENQRFWRHSKNKPVFGGKKRLFEECLVVDSQCINPETGLRFKQGDTQKEKIYLYLNRDTPIFLSPEQFKKRLNSNKVHGFGSTRTIGGVASSLIHDAKKRSAKHGGHVTITHSWICEQIPKGCAITGIPFQIGAENSTRSPLSASLDRIDSTNRSYTYENTRVVLTYVNNSLNMFSMQESAIILRHQLNSLERKEIEFKCGENENQESLQLA